ncbi:MAG: hypothetical protein H7336_16625 [Bacteriovorax sp.]|nr:hypothetical protein [Bacteriovorax sp.]
MPNFILPIFAIIISSIIPLSALAAQSDGQEGHGGDIAVSIFVGIAYKTAACLAESPESLKDYPLLLEDFNLAIARTSIYSVEKTVLNGNEVDAINYPTVEAPRILINRNRWLDDRLSTDMRALLVFHEYLSIAGYDDSSYKISYAYINKNKACINQGEK